jgi:hypothetical protein
LLVKAHFGALARSREAVRGRVRLPVSVDFHQLLAARAEAARASMKAQTRGSMIWCHVGELSLWSCRGVVRGGAKPEVRATMRRAGVIRGARGEWEIPEAAVGSGLGARIVRDANGKDCAECAREAREIGGDCTAGVVA